VYVLEMALGSISADSTGNLWALTVAPEKSCHSTL
jgi:hypothetical protein